MKRMPLLLIILIALWGTSLAPPVYAACSDVPGQDVYWRRCVFDRQDLTAVDLTGGNLREASFKRVDLSDSILEGIDGRRAKFVTAIMQDVVLDEANLVRADLTKANLQGASLRGADLTWARMFRADLTGADLTDARLENTDLLQAVLDGATWTDGETICAEGSIGRCRRDRSGATEKPSPEATPDVTEGEPPA